MHPVVLENKQRYINNRQRQLFKVICEPDTYFDLLGIIFRLVFEKY